MSNVIFRLANPYGSGQRASSGIGAVTVFLQSIINGEAIHIYGEGKAVRDYIYIDDAVNMMRMFLDAEMGKCEVPVFNIGTGLGKSIIEVLETIETVTGKNKTEFLSGRKIDVSRNVLDMSKVYSLSGGKYSPALLFVQILLIGGKLGVNCFVLISGYFLILSSESTSRILRIWLQVFSILYQAGVLRI